MDKDEHPENKENRNEHQHEADISENTKFTTYGVLVEQMSSASNISAEKCEKQQFLKLNNNQMDSDEELMQVQSSGDLSSEKKLLSRSYSLESGEILNDKFSSSGLGEDEENKLGLDTLPAELFLHICSFLDAKFVIKTLGRACKAFNAMVHDETFWRVRMGKRWNNRYPAVPVNEHVFNWAEACIEREEQYRLWSSHKENMQYFKFKEGLFAPVDVVHLMKKGGLLAAGSRDRYLSLLDVTKLDPNNPDSVKQCRVFSKMNAHKGWIWSMSSLDDTLVTGSWDTYIKFWDLAAEGQETMKIKCQSALLCTHYEPGYVMAGSYDKKVYHIDPRTASVIATKKYHKKPVLCMAVDDNFVVTGSEDNTVVVYDRRADKIRKKLNFDNYPMCMSYGRDQLWLGDKSGSIHLIDASDGDFNVVETYEDIHKGKVTGIIHSLGSMFTCSTDKSVKVLQPTLKPSIIASLEEHSQDIAEISFQNEVLACASSDVSIGLWKPTE